MAFSQKYSTLAYYSKITRGTRKDGEYACVFIIVKNGVFHGC